MTTPSTASGAAPDIVPAASAARVDPAQFAEHRQAMLRFARSRIRDADLAEDAVQEALASACAAAGSFEGQSALRTWLFGILNHKIHDAFRREGRYVQLATDEDGGDGLERLATLADQSL